MCSLVMNLCSHDLLVMYTITTVDTNYNWGKPERAPHKHEVRAVCLSVCLSGCLSFCPYVHDTKIYKSNSNLRVPSVVDCII